MINKNKKLIRKFRFSYQFLILFLFVVWATSILSHVIFSAGLNHDGAGILVKMIFKNSFDFFERSRLFFHFLYQLPTWLFIKFAPSNSLDLLTHLFSFGLIWIHIVSITGCWIILPKNKKDYIFFPLFAFLVGPLTALDHSISVSLSVFSYVWFVTFAVYYSDLSSNLHKLLFVLSPFPLFLSHELMSYASLLLIFFCIFKKKYKPETNIERFFIWTVISFFIIIFFISVYFILFPFSIENRDNFLSQIINLEFLYSKDKIAYPYIISALILIVVPFLQLLRISLIKNFLLSAFIFSALIVNTILLFPSSNHFLYSLFPNQLYPVTTNRIYVFLVLPWTLLLWFLFETRKLSWQSQKIFLALCFISSISILKWRLKIDYNFYQFQKQFSKNISIKFGEGIFENKSEEYFSFFPKALSNFYSYDLSFAASLIFPRVQQIKSVILNPAHPDCLISCSKGQNWITYYSFDSKENQYCKKTCLSYTNFKFDKKIQEINTRFFDFTILNEHIKKHNDFIK